MVNAKVKVDSAQELAAVQSGPTRIALRFGWVAIRLLLAFWLAERGAYFVYQGF